MKTSVEGQRAGWHGPKSFFLFLFFVFCLLFSGFPACVHACVMCVRVCPRTSAKRRTWRINSDSIEYIADAGRRVPRCLPHQLAVLRKRAPGRSGYFTVLRPPVKWL